MNRTIEIIAIAVALIAVALIADSWVSARRSAAQLAAAVTSQNVAIQQAATLVKQRDMQLAAALAAIEAAKRRIQTPKQAAAALPAVLPPLPLPVSIELPDLSAQTASSEAAPATISVPPSDLKPLYDGLQECRACSLDRDAIKKDLVDKQAQIVSLTHERDAAIAVAHGGTFWARLKHTTKWFAIGAVAGAAATAAVHR